MNKNAFGNHKSSLITIILAAAIAVSGVAVPNVAYAAETTSNTVTNADGSVTTTTVTKNDDGTTTTVTRTEVTEGEQVNCTIETVVTDANGKVKRSMTSRSSYGVSDEITDEDTNDSITLNLDISEIKPNLGATDDYYDYNNNIDLDPAYLSEGTYIKNLSEEANEEIIYKNNTADLFIEYAVYDAKNKLLKKKIIAMNKNFKAKVKNAYYVKARFFIKSKNLYSKWSDKKYLLWTTAIKKNNKVEGNGRYYIKFAKGSQNVKYLFYVKKGKKYKKLATGYSKKGKLNLSNKLPRDKKFDYKIVAKYKVNGSYKTKTIFKSWYKISVFIVAED